MEFVEWNRGHLYRRSTRYAIQCDTVIPQVVVRDGQGYGCMVIEQCQLMQLDAVVGNVAFDVSPKKVEVSGLWLKRQAADEGIAGDRDRCQPDIGSDIDVCTALLAEEGLDFSNHHTFKRAGAGIFRQHHAIVPGAGNDTAVTP